MSQVDRINGLIGNLGTKAPCNCATTTAITLSGAQTIDGYACTSADNGGMGTRVLVLNQANPVDNGIYYCNDAAWQRAPDFDGDRDVAQGTRVLVTGGTLSTNTEWGVTTANPVNIGISNVTFVLYVAGASAIASNIHVAGVKAVPVATDEFGFWDSVSGLLKKLTWANFLAIFSASSGSSLVGFLQAGTGAVAGTVQAELQKTVWADDFAGASVTAKIDAAIAAAAGRPVMIPATMGAGEPTSYPVGTALVDFRAATVGAGAKIVYNYSDALGAIRFLVANDIVSPTLSNAAGLFSTRASGTLPNSRNSEGIQCVANTIGTINNSPTNYILSAGEFDAYCQSVGGSIPFCYGINITAGTGSGNTTNITTYSAGIYIAPNAIAGTGTVANYYGILVDTPSPTNVIGQSFAAWFRGQTRFDAALNLNLGGVSGASGSFYSGGATKYIYQDLGRTAGELRLAVAGATNDLITGTAAGDGMVFNPSSGAIWIGTTGAGYINFTQNNSNVGIWSTSTFNISTAVSISGALTTKSNIVINGAAKVISALGAATSQSIPAGQAYTYFTTSGVSMATTLPNASAGLDGYTFTIVSSSSIATATWVSGGATFVGAPAAFTANVPVKIIYNHASTQWLPA